MKNLIFLFFLIISPIILIGQSSQAEYLEAKRLFNAKQYTSAKGAFGALTEDQDFGVYASFYYALSSYKQGDVNKALEMWSQILTKYPKWENKTEVLFWLAYANLEDKKIDKGIDFAASYSKHTNSIKAINDLYNKFIYTLDIEKIEAIYQRNSDDRNLAFFYIKKLVEQPYEYRDFNLINELNNKWQFNDYGYSFEGLSNEKKDKYKVGVVLPFMYDKSNLEWSIQNDLVMDMYQGMCLAQMELKARGVNIDLLPMDTKKNKDVTTKIVETLTNSPVDLLVGPLYPDPLDKVQKFSYESQTNMINPLSANSQIIAENPFAFLFRPTYETTAVELAKQANSQFSNKNAMIFYENNTRDSLFAATYKREIEDYGFEVVWYQELTKENAKSVLDTLIDQYEVFYTQEEADSIMEIIPKRFVKERRVRKDELDRVAKFEEGRSPWDSLYYLPVSINEDEKEVTYYENILYIKPDSLGHILGATRKNFMANNLISAVETMGDSTVIYGYGDWLDFTMLSYNQLERINVCMIDPNFIDLTSEAYKEFETSLALKFATLPTKYHFIGYELIMQAGNLLNDYGVYFQNELRKGAYKSGFILEGLRYGAANDNQIVPIIKFEDAQLKVVNKELYED